MGWKNLILNLTHYHSLKKEKKNQIKTTQLFGERKITSTIKLVHTKLHSFFLTIASLVYLMVNSINLR